MAGHAHFKFVGYPDDPRHGMNALPQSIAGIEFFNTTDVVDVSDLIAINELRKNPAVEEIGSFEPDTPPPARSASKAGDDDAKAKTK
jgi:hypothetical protein